MISIIICSRDQAALSSVSNNLSLSIGVPYEVIAIDNSKAGYSIFQAYNKGIEQSNYEMLCFMHEDVSFETKNWGQKVLDIFVDNPKLGLLGVAGSSYKSVVPSGWVFETNCNKIVSINVIQHANRLPHIHLFNNPQDTKLAKVASIDGLWFCTPKYIAEKIKFDEKTFTGFHCYDVDYSLSVLQHHDVAVTFDILINHFSGGSLNDSWVTETLKLHNKWKSVLPIDLNSLPKKESQMLEFEAFHSILPKLKAKKTIALGFIQTLWISKVAALVGFKKFVIMNLVVFKKAFD